MAQRWICSKWQGRQTEALNESVFAPEVSSDLTTSGGDDQYCLGIAISLNVAHMDYAAVAVPRYSAIGSFLALLRLGGFRLSIRQ